MELSSTAKGRHSELVASSALLANGYIVMEPMVPDAFDVAITRRGSDKIIRVQIKMIKKRFYKGDWWYIVKGRKNNGEVYSEEDCDMFAGVIDGKVYMLWNTGLTEYWQKVGNADDNWIVLPVGLDAGGLDVSNEGGLRIDEVES